MVVFPVLKRRCERLLGSTDCAIVKALAFDRSDERMRVTACKKRLAT